MVDSATGIGTAVPIAWLVPGTDEHEEYASDSDGPALVMGFIGSGDTVVVIEGAVDELLDFGRRMAAVVAAGPPA